MKEIANGVWPVMITPFTADNKIDYEAVQRIIDWYADHKVTGIFAVCQSSEMFFLTKEERLELAKYVIDHGHEKGMGVIASGHVAESVEDQIAEAQACGDMAILSERGRRCLHLHLPDNSGVTLRCLSNIVAQVLSEIERSEQQ